MADSIAPVRKEIATRTVLLCVIFLLAGLLLISFSVVLGYQHRCEYLRELAKELGIVLFAVFTVSLVYERLLAERHLDGFRILLQEQIEQAVSNAAACSELGILKIFTRRDLFEMEHSLQAILAALGAGGSARVVAISLFHLMNKTDLFKQALEQGSRIELCFLNPASSPSQVAKLPDLELEDIRSAIAVFAKKFPHWLATNTPPGSIELRYHEVAVPESFSHFSSSPLGNLVVWDLSFGRDLRDKRILLVDPNKTLGLDLRKRFDFVFRNAAVAFQYHHGAIKVNDLTKSMAS